MDFLAQYGLFLAKIVTVVMAILVIISSLFSFTMRNREKNSNKLSLKKLNKKYAALSDELQQKILPKKDYHKWLKTEKKRLNFEAEGSKPRIFVLHFDGDLKASGVAELREEITALLTIITTKDEVVVCLESGGGMVHSYGLAASQLQRLRDRAIPLTIIIDKIAASGGYMMACVANKIISAPFAIIGSIGVIIQMPNFNRWLKKNTIDYEQLTAGQFKRTLTLFGENTDSSRQKMQQELEMAHKLFKDFIKQYRPQVDLEKIATGEHWFGISAKALDLIDAIQTSDDYLLAASHVADVFELKYQHKKPFAKRLGLSIQKVIESFTTVM